MIQIKSCVWHNLFKPNFAIHTIIVVLWNSRTFASQDKVIYNTKTKHTRSCSTNYSMSLSLFNTKWKIHKKFSLGEFFYKNQSYEWGTIKNYTLLNRHFISIITVVHRLTDSKIKIIKYYNLDKIDSVHIC